MLSDSSVIIFTRPISFPNFRKTRRKCAAMLQIKISNYCLKHISFKFTVKLFSRDTLLPSGKKILGITLFNETRRIVEFYKAERGRQKAFRLMVLETFEYLRQNMGNKVTRCIQIRTSITK